MKGNDNVTKQIHLFQANLHQLVVTNVTVPNDKRVICLMRSMLPNYRTFISPLRRQLHRIFQFFITNLIQKETLMKDMNLRNESSSILYARKRYSKYNSNKFTKYNKKIPPRD
jgi:hypothetical protein